ncbi:MAG: hypothetical protein QXI93_04490 [Candidatus Methanomethylicia archaeon]
MEAYCLKTFTKINLNYKSIHNHQFTYNGFEATTITIPLAAYILYSQRILLPPVLEAIIMP